MDIGSSPGAEPGSGRASAPAVRPDHSLYLPVGLMGEPQEAVWAAASGWLRHCCRDPALHALRLPALRSLRAGKYHRGVCLLLGEPPDLRDALRADPTRLDGHLPGPDPNRAAHAGRGRPGPGAVPPGDRIHPTGSGSVPLPINKPRTGVLHVLAIGWFVSAKQHCPGWRLRPAPAFHALRVIPRGCLLQAALPGAAGGAALPVYWHLHRDSPALL